MGYAHLLIYNITYSRKTAADSSPLSSVRINNTYVHVVLKFTWRYIITQSHYIENFVCKYVRM